VALASVRDSSGDRVRIARHVGRERPDDEQRVLRIDGDDHAHHDVERLFGGHYDDHSEHLVVELRGQLDFGNDHSRIDGRFVGPARRADLPAQPSTPLGSFAGSQPRTATAWRNAKRSVMPAT